MSDASPQFELKLFRAVPSFRRGNTEIRLHPKSRDLIVFLAYSGEHVYVREDLIAQIYDVVTPETKDEFRRHALGNIPASVREACIERNDNGNIISFKNRNILVDVHQFNAQVDLIRESNGDGENSAFLLEAFQQLQDLYKSDFLTVYAEDAGISEKMLYWRDQQEYQLRRKYAGIFENFVQHHIMRQQFDTALDVANQWQRLVQHKNDTGADYTVAKYKVWLHAQHRNFDAALEQLQRILDAHDDPSLNLDYHLFARWHDRFVNQRQSLAIEELGLSYRLVPSQSVQLDATDIGNLVGRNSNIETVFTLLFYQPTYPILNLTGLPGMGKTRLAQTVQAIAVKQRMIDCPIYVSCQAEMTFGQLLNEIAIQLEQVTWISKDQKTKKQLILSELKNKSALFVIDHFEKLDLSIQPAILEAFQQLVEVTRSKGIIVSHTALRDEIPTLELQGLVIPYISELAHQLTPDWNHPRLDQVDEAIWGQLKELTLGSPLLLNIIFKSWPLDSDSLRTISMRIAIRLQATVKPGFEYEMLCKAIFQLAWSRLTEIERTVLISLLHFAFDEGATESALCQLNRDSDALIVKQALSKLQMVGLIWEKVVTIDGPLYVTHATIYQLVNGMVDVVSYATHFTLTRNIFVNYFLNFIENYQTEWKQLESTRKTFMGAINIALDQHDLRVIDTILQLNSFLNTYGYYELGIELILKSIQSFGQLAEHNLQLQLNLVSFYEKSGQYDLSQSVLESVLRKTENSNDAKIRLDILLQIAVLHIKQQNYIPAQQYLMQALTLAQVQQDKFRECRVWGNLGSSYSEMDQFEAAQHCFKACLQAAEELKNNSMIAFALQGLGLVAIKNSEYRSAKHLNKLALEAAQKINHQERIAYSYVNLGVANYCLEQYELASEELLQGLAIAEQIKHLELIATSMWNLGAVDAASGAYLQAEERLKRSLQLSMQIGREWFVVGILAELGKLNVRQHMYALAIRDFNAGWHNSVSGNFKFPAAKALYGTCLTELTREFSVGSRNIDDAVNVISPLLTESVLAGIHQVSIDTESLRKAEYFFQQGLSNYPRISDYCIVEALTRLISASQ